MDHTARHQLHRVLTAKKLKKASLAAVTFTVAPNEKILTEPPEPLITADIDGNADTLDKPKILIPFGNSDVFPWQVATLITTVLWLITLIYAFVSKGNAQTQAKAHTHRNISLSAFLKILSCKKKAKEKRSILLKFSKLRM